MTSPNRNEQATSIGCAALLAIAAVLLLLGSSRGAFLPWLGGGLVLAFILAGAAGWLRRGLLGAASALILGLILGALAFFLIRPFF